MQEIKVKFAGIEKSKDGQLSILYIPNQTQVLVAGKKYQIVIEGLSYEEWGSGKKRRKSNR